MSIQENEVVMCTVKRIEGTTVFLDIEENGEGTMVFSEVSPGRIRNIREFVSPGKKVVCKVLRIVGGHPQLSLRRVTGKEREEVVERFKKEKMLVNMIKPVLKEKTQSIIEKIKKEYDLADFLDEAKEDSKLLEKFVTKAQAEELQKIFVEKKDKEKSVKRELKITSSSPSGINDLKEILTTKEVEVYYLGSSRFMVEATAKDYKIANHKLEEVLESIRKKAKQLHAKIEIKEK